MYGKLFRSMYDGSLSSNWKALITFQQMVILSDSEGVVDMTPDAIARTTNIPLDIIQEGIVELELPDPSSRTPDEEGKRIMRLDNHRAWGWKVVNHAYYKKLASYEDKKQADRERIAAKRKAEKDNENKGVAESSAESKIVADVAHTDKDTDKDKVKKPYTLNFETCWSHYPRKVEKKKAFKAYQVRIRQGIPHKDLLIATQNYSRHCASKEPQYIKHGATFYGPDDVYLDWLTDASKGSPYSFTKCNHCGYEANTVKLGDECPMCEKIVQKSGHVKKPKQTDLDKLYEND